MYSVLWTNTHPFCVERVMAARTHLPVWSRIGRSSFRTSAASRQRKAHSCSRLSSIRNAALHRQHQLYSRQSELSRSAILYYPTEPTMASLHRAISIDLDEPIDLSTKSEQEINAILKELQRRYTVNMVNNAQLDNEKQSLYYQVEDMQGKLDDETDSKGSAAQELKSWTHRVEEEKRRKLQLDMEISRMKEMIGDRNQLIKDNNMVLVPISSPSTNTTSTGKHTEMDDKVIKVLHYCPDNFSSKQLDRKIKDLIAENEDIRAQVMQTKQDLQEVRQDNSTRWRYSQRSSYTCSAVELAKIEREQSIEIAKHKQDATQAGLKIDSLENQLLRLEAQMHRHREVFEESEKVSHQLKADNRKINRQYEESSRQLMELQRECEHLNIRVEKVRNARDNALNMVASDTNTNNKDATVH